MPRYVVFLRAVNVAPRWVPMARLREVLTHAGFTEVATHIQTGNVRVASSRRSPARVAAAVEDAVRAEWGFSTDAMVRTPAGLRAILATADAIDPGPGEIRRGVSFAKGPVTLGSAELASWEVPGEWAHPAGSEVYWGLARPMHQSTLSNARIERLIRQPATTRDLRVVRAIVNSWC